MTLGEVLKTWRSINHHIHALDESAVKQLLDMEIAGQRRLTVLERIHQRYTMLRAERERREILALAGERHVG